MNYELFKPGYSLQVLSLTHSLMKKIQPSGFRALFLSLAGIWNKLCLFLLNVVIHLLNFREFQPALFTLAGHEKSRCLPTYVNRSLHTTRAKISSGPTYN
jgi:hypothetical protein